MNQFRIIPAYRPRFVRPEDMPALSEMWHLSATARSGQGRHARLLWASGEFSRKHGYVSATGAYKDLCGMLGD